MSTFGWNREPVPEPEPGLVREVKIPAGMVTLPGTLVLPRDALGVVLFVHGSGSSRQSPRNRAVARMLNEAGIATLLFDLLTRDEERLDREMGALRFNISLLAERLCHAMDWLQGEELLRELPVGYFGASTGSAAALVAAAAEPGRVRAVVSRGGRPELADAALYELRSPTLLIVGEEDDHVVALNRAAMDQIYSAVKLVVIQGATHPFEEPGALAEISHFASDWFLEHFVAESVGTMEVSLQAPKRRIRPEHDSDAE